MLDQPLAPPFFRRGVVRRCRSPANHRRKRAWAFGREEDVVLQKILLYGEIERRSGIGAAVRALANNDLADVSEPLPVLVVGSDLPQNRGPEAQQLWPPYLVPFAG